jgi:hypothetical protein
MRRRKKKKRMKMIRVRARQNIFDESAVVFVVAGEHFEAALSPNSVIAAG